MKNKSLTVIAYANGFTIWHYTCTDESLEQVLHDGFFYPISHLCANGDIIYITCDGKTYQRQIFFKDLKPCLTKIE